MYVCMHVCTYYRMHVYVYAYTLLHGMCARVHKRTIINIDTYMHMYVLALRLIKILS